MEKRMTNEAAVPSVNKTLCKRAMQLFLATVVVSFLGWCCETVYALIRFGRFVDRGFLALPLCPIYGITLLLMSVLLGTPFHGRISRLLDKTKLPKAAKCALNILLYAIASIIVPTLFELIVGAFFDLALGVRLWDYSMFPYNYHGYICLRFSLLWGGALTAAMATVWHWLLLGLEHVGDRLLLVCAIVFAALIVADFLFNVSYLLAQGHHFTWC